MPVDERDAFEEHYFSCLECAEEVRAGAQFRANYGYAGAVSPAPARERWWRAWLRWPSLVPVAASLVFAGIVWFQAGRRPLMDAVDDYTVRETVRSGAAALVPRGAGPAAISFVIPADAPAAPYECAITDAAGKTLAAATLERPAGSQGRVLLQRDRLRPGLYTLTLRSGGAPVAQYSFQLQ